MYDLYRTLEPAIPTDHCRQTQPRGMMLELLRNDRSLRRVLDLGCGDGSSIDYFREHVQDLQWRGLDTQDSPEALGRRRPDADIQTFDGVHLPLEDGVVDLVYAELLLEHVRHPDALVPEVRRVLRPGGYFVGSVSYLEPYHSRSIFNFTPFGLHEVLRSAGLQTLELRPGIDGPTLIARRMLRWPRFFDIFFRRESPLNFTIGLAGRLFGAKNDTINSAKLLYSGLFSWIAQRPFDDGESIRSG